MKPDRAAVILAAPAAIGLAGAAAVMLRACWRIPECDDDGNDLEAEHFAAVADITRERIPDYVPAEWTKGIS